MKSSLQIIVGTTILMSGSFPAFGNSLLNPNTHANNRWTYIYFDRILYNHGGLDWDRERANRRAGNRNLNDRWYYHYGQKLQSDNKHPYYQGKGHIPRDSVYSQPNYTPRSFKYRKPTQIRDHIPRNSFRYRSPFPRARIGH